MSTGRSLACLLGVGVLALALPAVASAQTCFYVGTAPDGRVLGPYFLNSATNDISLSFKPDSGKSYVVDAMTFQGPSGGGDAALAININSSFCPSTDVAAGVTIRDITTVSPGFDGAGSERRSLVFSSAFGFMETRIHVGNASTNGVVVSVTDSTLYSPAWSTFGSFDTFYSFLNTTTSTCNVTLTMRDTAGVLRTTFAGAVAAGTTFATNTSSLGTARNLAGTARLTHDCPVGSIVAEAAIANFSISPTPYFQFVKFVGIAPQH